MGTRGRRSRPPADTPEGREMQLVSLAYDYAERQFLEGNASAQVTTHFLKMGSTRNKLEEAKIMHENLVLAAKVEQMASAGRMEVLYEDAIRVMRQYSGQDPDPQFEQEGDYYG